MVNARRQITKSRANAAIVNPRGCAEQGNMGLLRFFIMKVNRLITPLCLMQKLLLVAGIYRILRPVKTRLAP
jgi:hypothetical protein